MALAATNGLTAGANCKRHDAAPVLFGRAASAAGTVRRLAGLNAMLGCRKRVLRRPISFFSNGFEFGDDFEIFGTTCRSLGAN